MVFCWESDAWSVSSNKESGDGYSDILVETEDGRLDDACRGALEQIEHRRYEEELLEEGISHILKYGVAFREKKCRVMLAGRLRNWHNCNK